MSRTVEVLLLVILPLAWGLGSEYIFERIRLQLAKRKEESPRP